MMNNVSRLRVRGLGLAAALLFVPVVAGAAIVGRPSEGQERYVLPKETTVFDDFYVGGADVSVYGAVSGDLTAAGEQVRSVGSVADDSFLIGATVTVAGSYGDDVRLIAADATVEAVIPGDLVAVAADLSVSSASQVYGDILLAAQDAVIRGDVLGNVKAAGESVLIDGFVGGDVKVVSALATIGPYARIAGDVVWYGDRAPVVEDGAVIVGEVRQGTSVIAPLSEHVGSIVPTFAALGAIMLLLAVIASILIAPRPVAALVSSGTNVRSVLRTALIGLAVLIGSFAAGALLVISVVGLTVGAAIISAAVAFCLLAYVGSAFVSGGMALQLVYRTPEQAHSVWKAGIVGTLVLTVLSMIPFVGNIVTFILFLSAFGIITRAVFRIIRPAPLAS